MREPIQVLTDILERLDQDPFEESTEDIRARIERIKENHKVELNNAYRILQIRLDREAEIEATIEFIKGIK